MSATPAAPKPLDDLIASILTSLAGRPLLWDPFAEVPSGGINNRPGIALTVEGSLVLTCVMQAARWRRVRAADGPVLPLPPQPVASVDGQADVVCCADLNPGPTAMRWALHTSPSSEGLVVITSGPHILG